jgi:hypothetical protein
MDSISKEIVPQVILFLMKRKGMGYEDLMKKSGASDKDLKRLLYGDGGDLEFDVLMDLGCALGEGKLGIFKYMYMFEKMSDDERLILFLLWGAFAKGEGKGPGRDEKTFWRIKILLLLMRKAGNLSR